MRTVILSVFMLLPLAGQAAYGASAGFLRVYGSDVLDASGKTIHLRGFNVNFNDFETGRLGRGDVKNIRGLGANCIRLVIDYRSFEKSPFRYEEKSFALLSRLLKWCSMYRVLVILDMHLVPGIQNPHDFVFHRKRLYRFWSEKENRGRYYSLLAEVAKRCRGSDSIAGYDLLNEGVPPDIDMYREVMNRAARTIRSFDKSHILVVEEAILPDGRKELIKIHDDNAIYSIHFYFPHQFTMYATSQDRAVTRYPGEMETYGQGVAEARSETVTGTREWRRISIKAAPPKGADILAVGISSDRNYGTVWFDDVSLTVDGRPVDLPAPLVPNNSFEIDYQGFAWNLRGACVSVEEGVARTGRHSLAFSHCSARASARSSPIGVSKGEYVLAGWVKSSGGTGSSFLSLFWYKKKVLAHIDKAALLEQLEYALEFSGRYNVPLYVGEFTVHENPSRESVENYLMDLLRIMKDKGIHWTYWEYYSDYPGIALYSGDGSLKMPDALKVLEQYLREEKIKGPSGW